MDGAVRGRELRLSPVALLAAPAAFLLAFYAWPMAHVLAAASSDAWSWVASPYVVARLRVAALQALLSVALTLALAAPLAWLHHARRIPASRWHLALHAAPFVLPVFVVVYGLQLTIAPLLAAPLVAVVIAHAYYNYGFAARLLHAALDRRPRRLENAAETLGASPRGAFWRVAFPLLLPAMAAVALLVFLFTFASFGTVLFLGGGEVSTAETLLYANLAGAFPRANRAAALGAVQLALNLALFLAYAWLLRRADRGLERESIPRRGKARAWHVALAWGALAAGLVPMLAVLLGGFRVRGAWTLEPWRALLDADHPAHAAGFDLARAIGLSLGYAAATLALALTLTLLLAYGARKLGGAWRTVAEALAALPLGTSSLLLGFGYALAFGAGALLDLRGSALVIVLVHTLVAFPFTARVILPALDLHDRRLDEAAALLGAPPASVVARVHLPLLAAPLAAAAGLAAAMSLGDFGASVLLMRPDNMALSVWIARVDKPFDPLAKAQATALAGLLALLVAACYLLAERLRPLEEAAP